MAWVYLPRISRNEVLDVRRMNEHLMLLGAKSVDLGEESWASGWLTEDDCAQDVALRYWKAGIVNTATPLRNGPELQSSDTWRPLSPSNHIEGVTRGGWILARAQVCISNPDDEIFNFMPVGMELALEVNGVIYQHGGIGAADRSAETIKAAAILSADPSLAFDPIRFDDNQYGPGLRSPADMVAFGAAAYLPEGPITIRAMYRNVAPTSGQAPQALVGFQMFALEVQGRP